jgi:DNA-binding MarR family transcriptional regulator
VARRAASAEHVQGEAAGLVRRLLDVAPRLMRLETHRLASLPTSLTHRQYRILQRVGQGATSSTLISRRANVSLAAISESVEALSRRGLISREQDLADRRANRLALTERGHEAWQAAEVALDELSRELSHSLPPRVLRHALRAIEEIEESVRMESGEGRDGR